MVFYPVYIVLNPLLTKLVWSKWLDIGLILFLRVYGPKKELGQYPAILTSRLVNNPNLLSFLAILMEIFKDQQKLLG